MFTSTFNCYETIACICVTSYLLTSRRLQINNYILGPIDEGSLNETWVD